MERFEFKVIPAPRRGLKGPGRADERFAQALTQVLSAMGREGWDYLRVDQLPFEQRTLLGGTKVLYAEMLVFRRALGAQQSDAPPASAAAMEEGAPAPLRRPLPTLGLGSESPALRRPSLGAPKAAQEPPAPPLSGANEETQDAATQRPGEGLRANR